jgi:VanZ family protein
VLPLVPTLDVSQVWHNIKASHVALGTGFAVHPWHHWLVERVGVYGALAAILGGCSLRSFHRRWIDAALVTTSFALALEVAKLFIVSRSANTMNILSSAAGAAVGTILAAAFSRRVAAQTKAALATVAIVLYIVYLELTPFNFAWNSQYIAKKWPVGSEWLPLYSYALRGSMEDVQLFVQGIALSAAFIYCLCIWTDWLRRGTRIGRVLVAASVTGALGVTLEAAQFLLPDYAVGQTIVSGRTPSTSDVFCYAVGGALGALVWIMIPPCETSTVACAALTKKIG